MSVIELGYCKATAAGLVLSRLSAGRSAALATFPSSAIGMPTGKMTPVCATRVRVISTSIPTAAELGRPEDLMTEPLATATDVPVSGDWNADGRDEFGVQVLRDRPRFPRPSYRKCPCTLRSQNEYSKVCFRLNPAQNRRRRERPVSRLC